MIRRTHLRMWLCIALLCLNIAFIWGNSLLPGEISRSVSDWVRSVLLGFGNRPDDQMQGGHGLLRKLAHFSEFCSLGLLLSWLTRMLRTSPADYLRLPLLVGVLCACADEMIQYFVPDRAPGILDVGIDALGLCLGIGLMYLLLQTVKKRKLKYLEE